MRDDHTVSAVITCYNLDWAIGPAIESVIPHLSAGEVSEIIVVDDGSTDTSRSVIERYCVKYPQIVTVFKKNGGVAASKNAGIKVARHPLIAFLDADDLWSAEKFAIQQPFFSKYPQAGIYTGDYTVETIGQPGSVTVAAPAYSATAQDNLRRLFLSGGIIPSAAVVRAEVFAKVGMFNETIRYVQDEEMWARAARHYSIQRTPGVVLHKREHANNMSSNVLARVQSLENMTAKYLELDPSLGTAVVQRQQRVRMMRAKALLALGRKAEARVELRRAWTTTPLRGKPLLYLAAAMLPGDPLNTINYMKTLSGRRKRS